MARNTHFLLAAISFAANLSVATMSRADSYFSCLKADSAFEKIEQCSRAIRARMSKKQIERAYLRRGNAFMEMGRFADAIGDFSAAIRINPKIAGYYDNRQNAFKALGRLKEALDDANRTIKLAPTYSFAYRSRGLVRAEMGALGSAIADFNAAISFNPLDAGIFVDRGKLFGKAGRTSDAIDDFSKAVQINPKAFEAYRERGLLYKRIGDFQAARDDLTIFSRFDPTDQEVTRALDEIDKAASKTSPSSPGVPEARGRATTTEPPSSEDFKSAALGTGFFVSTDGYVVTNAHVVDECETPQISIGLLPAVTARVLARDTPNDLALLKADVTVQKPATLRAGVKVGEQVAAFGYPLLGLLSTGGNFTTGNVSAVAGLGNDTRYLQISAPVQSGNSGGPLVDQSGNVVGIVASKLNVLKVAEAINDVPQNVNFAIKAAVLTNFLDSTGVKYTIANSGPPIPQAQVAEQAKSISILIKCEKRGY